MMDIMSSLGWLILSFLANPLLYLGFIIIAFISAGRVKRERESFHTRVYSKRADWTIPLLPALLMGGALSLITGLVGVVVTIEWLLLVAALYVLTALTCQLRWISPAFVLGLCLLFYGMEPWLGESSMLAGVYERITLIPLFALAGLASLFVIAEGILIRTNGARFSSPKLRRSKRGKWVGFHEAKRLWVVPVLFFIPDGLLPSFSYWPVLQIGDGGWQPVLLPLLFGFQQRIKATLPHIPIRQHGNRLFFFGLILGGLAAASYYSPYVAVVLGAAVIAGRELIWLLAKEKDEKQPDFFSAKEKGCVVLGVLPGSPAEKMNLEIGEIIVKVNGQPVSTDENFYEALQQNSAFCKLEILTHEGELRFAQGAIYDGGHHQLGVLLVKDDIQLQDSII
ncbi:PDZ domain-containing protein [Alkalihalobacillus oceani]|uniref:PDZ domain-containing protein n=1 Tax=Halalkalibacter oceani TaxID=1653776 RepID=A0A9X2DQI8_9BACI|nr:PDZ domain-containing protein [Halalkalibacter oceani]MCM3714633.1 PDZ domain-containing protein [Halalkalibacter oceani]